MIESALPLAAMNAAGRAEKAVPRPGLPATMHIWWSRKPTGLARAVLFASIVDDPDDRAEHQRLADLVADLAHWDCPPERLQEARQLVLQQCGGNPPPVIDPFCGGGVIPLEAGRLGLRSVAGDLNPVAALITKGLVEIPSAVAGKGPVHPRATLAAGAADRAGGIAADIAAYGDQLLAEVHARIGHHYPSVQGGPAVSYLWARSGTCANPGCGGELPLLSTWWLRRSRGPLWHVAPVLPASRRGARPDRIDFEVRQGPPPDDLVDLKVGNGATYRCPLCGEATPSAAVREQSRQGTLGLRLVAIQTFSDPERPRNGRSWMSADEAQSTAALQAWPDERTFPLGEEAFPVVSGNIGLFGLDTVEKLLTPRQRLLMVTMCDCLRDLTPVIQDDARRAGLDGTEESPGIPLRDHGHGARAHAEAVTTYLALAISRMANRVSTMTVHNRANGSVEQSFIQPGYVFYGDFPEANPFSGSTGSFANSLKHVVATVAALPAGGPPARVTCGSAVDVLDDTVRGDTVRGIVSTDPPYYDMFDYSALSNLFYTWLRLALSEIWPDETATAQAPDRDQIVSNQSRFDGDKERAHAHFESGLRDAVAALRSVQLDDFPLTLYYGYQQTQRRAKGRSSTAWEVLLEALIDNGFQVVSTWPLRTERPEGVKTGSSSLASSMLLACRRRPPSAERLSREGFRSELETSLREAIRTFQEDSITPVDLAQSAIGPGMVIYSSYEEVLEDDGTPMGVRAALELIHHALDEAVADSDTGYDAETRWAIEWFESRGREPDDRGAAEQLATAHSTSVDRLAETGIVVAEPGKVRLRSIDEWAGLGAPGSVWAATHRLCHRLEDGDESAAAEVLAELDSDAATNAKALAYRLYLICAERRWASEAAVVNNIVRAWPNVEKHVT